MVNCLQSGLLLEELAPGPSPDALQCHDDHLLGLRMKHHVVVVDASGALAFMNYVRSRKAVFCRSRRPLLKV